VRPQPTVDAAFVRHLELGDRPLLMQAIVFEAG
jgi:hypothetical protein